jgi:hypothetical protein
MSVPQLKQELRRVRDQIKRFSDGRYELLYEDLLMTELECRGIDVAALSRLDDEEP